jgi:hypothetical protein
MNTIITEDLTIYNFHTWNKLDIDNLLLSDEITIDNKIYIFGNFVKWKYNNIILNTTTNNVDMYPFINLFLTYIYIKEKLIIDNVKLYLSNELELKSTLDSFSNKQILSSVILTSFFYNIYQSF